MADSRKPAFINPATSSKAHAKALIKQMKKDAQDIAKELDLPPQAAYDLLLEMYRQEDTLNTQESASSEHMGSFDPSTNPGKPSTAGYVRVEPDFVPSIEEFPRSNRRFNDSVHRSSDGEASAFHFSLPGLLPESQMLALHSRARTLSLLGEGVELLAQEQFSHNEFRVLKAVLEAFPYYCPYEVLLASLTTHAVNVSTITQSHKRLQVAQSHGKWRQELRPVRRALSSLRSKLHVFHLEISVIRDGGYSLTDERRLFLPLMSSTPQDYSRFGLTGSQAAREAPARNEGDTRGVAGF